LGNSKIPQSLLIVMQFKIKLLDNFFDIHKEYRKLDSQKENTCGAYNLAYILRGLGFKDVSVDYIAYLAKMNVHENEYRKFIEAKKLVKEGKLSEEEAKRLYYEYWYEYDYRITRYYAESGISPKGLVVACEKVTDGKYCCLPIPSRKGDKIFFTKENFARLIDYIFSKGEIQVVLNYHTSKLLDPNGKFYYLSRILEFHNHPEMFEKWKWIVGHFVSLAGILEFEDDRWLIIRDTYKKFGFNGYHLQPAEYVRGALLRGDGREGGMFLIIKSERRDEIKEEVENIGLKVDLWDNGSPYVE